MTPENRLWRLQEVLAMCGISKSGLYAMMSRNHFPRPLRIGLRAVAWRATDVQTWLDSRPEATS